MLIFGSSEMILVHSGVLRDMKNKFLRSELIMATTVGHNSDMGQYNAGSVRRGFQVFAKNCGNCHGNLHRKYDAV